MEGIAAVMEMAMVKGMAHGQVGDETYGRAPSVAIRAGRRTAHGCRALRRRQGGVTIVNRSATDELVMLKHFGPRA